MLQLTRKRSAPSQRKQKSNGSELTPLTFLMLSYSPMLFLLECYDLSPSITNYYFTSDCCFTIPLKPCSAVGCSIFGHYSGTPSIPYYGPFNSMPEDKAFYKSNVYMYIYMYKFTCHRVNTMHSFSSLSEPLFQIEYPRHLLQARNEWFCDISN